MFWEESTVDEDDGFVDFEDLDPEVVDFVALLELDDLPFLTAFDDDEEEEDGFFEEDPDDDREADEDLALFSDLSLF